jgi:chaperone BCS1
LLIFGFTTAELYEKAHVAITHNQFLQGGLVVAVCTGIVAYFRKAPGKLYYWCRGKALTTLTIQKEDYNALYNKITVWLTQFETLKKKTRNLNLKLSNYTTDSKEAEEIFDIKPDLRGKLRKANIKIMPVVECSPGFGTHWFWYKRRFVYMTRIEEKAASGTTPAQKAAYNFTIFSRNRKFIIDFFQEMAILNLFQKDKEVKVHSKEGNGWREICSRPPRPFDSLILDGQLKHDILHDVQGYINGEKWYRSVGVPYRRGYLFEGPPGNGKSTLVSVLAGELNEDICILNLNDYSVNDSNLSLLLSYAPAKIILIEDVDAIGLPNREDKTDGPQLVGVPEAVQQTLGGRGVTFAGFINALDGVAAQEGKIIVMTTNHAEKLDPALIRPGRCDRRFEINNASRQQIRELFTRFFPAQEPYASRFASYFKDEEMSMAQMQEILMQNRDDYMGAMKYAVERHSQREVA